MLNAQPSVTGHRWVDLLILTVTVTSGLLFLWRKLFHPLIKVAAVIDTVVPVLVTIGTEFSPNHGSSLKDTVGRIDERLERVEAATAALEIYVHDANHKTMTVATTTSLAQQTALARLADLQATADKAAEAAAAVAADLAVAHGRAAQVTPDAEPGVAADEFSRGGEPNGGAQ